MFEHCSNKDSQGADEVTEGRRAGVRRPERPDLFSGLMMSNMGSLLPKMGKLSMDVEEMMKESQSGHSFSSSQVSFYCTSFDVKCL